MGEVNLAVGRMMAQKDVFADYVNGTCYGGKQVLRAEDLELVTTHRGVTRKRRNGKKRTMELDGDVRMKADYGTYSVIFAEENQESTHYAMPIRCMHYDALEYYEQWLKMKDGHEKAKDLHSGEELLSGMKKDDKFMPVMSSVLFTGKSWDGPTELYDVLDFGDGEDVESWKQFIPNYKINLVNMSEFENPDVFRSCLQHVFSMVKYKDDKDKFQQYRTEHRDELECMGNIANDALVAILGESSRVLSKMNENSDGKEESGVCKAIDALIEDGKAEGRLEGRTEGGNIKVLEQVCKKLRKGKPVEVIADELEEEVDVVRKMVEFAMPFGPEFDLEQVSEAWRKSQ